MQRSSYEEMQKAPGLVPGVFENSSVFNLNEKTR